MITNLCQDFFDILGIIINRDDVRTPMQWDGLSKGRSLVHEHYTKLNVEKLSKEDDSLRKPICA